MPYKDPQVRRSKSKEYHYRWLNKSSKNRALFNKIKLDSYYRNHEEVRASRKAHYEANKEEINAKRRAAHSEKRREAVAQKKAEKAIKKEQDRDSRLARIREWAKQYRAENPEQFRAYRQRRHARKSGAPINDLTPEQWRTIQEAQDHRCAYCGKRYRWRLTQDHITPLSKGGSHTLHNVVGACKNCNSRKNVNAPLAPVQPFLL